MMLTMVATLTWLACSCPHMTPMASDRHPSAPPTSQVRLHVSCTAQMCSSGRQALVHVDADLLAAMDATAAAVQVPRSPRSSCSVVTITACVCLISMLESNHAHLHAHALDSLTVWPCTAPASPDCSACRGVCKVGPTVLCTVEHVVQLDAPDILTCKWLQSCASYDVSLLFLDGPATTGNTLPYGCGCHMYLCVSEQSRLTADSHKRQVVHEYTIAVMCRSDVAVLCRYLDQLNGVPETLYTAGYPSTPCRSAFLFKVLCSVAHQPGMGCQ